MVLAQIHGWTWGQDRIHGVNLGGWLVLPSEPALSHRLSEPFCHALPVYDYPHLHSRLLRADTRRVHKGLLLRRRALRAAWADRHD